LDDGRRPLVLVHGDTFTTVLGAAMGRALGADVAHVEAGLRSGSWRNPFPEELDRRITSRLATVHLAPGQWAADNLRAAGVAGKIVDTGDNTIRDALDLVPPQTPEIELPSDEFGVVSLHRFELLGQPKEFRAALEALRDASRSTPLVFIDHPVTAATISSERLDDLFDDTHFVRVPRQRYFPFIALLKASAFLVTDSGGSQEECAALGHPCLVHRATTERQDGLGGPVVLSRMDLNALTTFLEDPQRYRRPPVSTQARPSDTIFATLRADGFL
jgi:UDP-N-acetylglucosamine 2-epimerase (non-hydrolysing)